MRRRKRRYLSPLKKVTKASPKKVENLLNELRYIKGDKDFRRGDIHIHVKTSKKAPKQGAVITAHKDIFVREAGQLKHKMKIDSDVQKAIKELMRKVKEKR